MLRLTINNDNLLGLIKGSMDVDTMFGLAYSNVDLNDLELLDKVRTVFKAELKDNDNVNVFIKNDCIVFDLLGSTTKLDIDGKFMAFTKPELIGVITLLDFVDPNNRKV